MDAITRINTNQRSDTVDTAGALIEALIMFGPEYARADVPKALFMITDSPSNVNSDFLADQKEVLESEGVDVFAIGIGISDKSELETIATNPRNVHTVTRFSDLSTLTNVLRRDVRSCKLIYYLYNSYKALSMFQSILLSQRQSINHDNALYISNYYFYFIEGNNTF